MLWRLPVLWESIVISSKRSGSFRIRTHGEGVPSWSSDFPVLKYTGHKIIKYNYYLLAPFGTTSTVTEQYILRSLPWSRLITPIVWRKYLKCWRRLQRFEPRTHGKRGAILRTSRFWYRENSCHTRRHGREENCRSKFMNLVGDFSWLRYQFSDQDRLR